MKKILLTLSGIILFFISSQTFAQEIVRYSEYSEDWTLDKQLFDLWDSNISFDNYKTKIFQVAKFEDWFCSSWEDFAEFWENFQWLWRLEIIWNNSNEATFWKFKPWEEFWNLENEDFIEFCYWEKDWILDSKIKIKRTKKQLSLKTIWNWDQKKVVVSKIVWDNWTDIEISLRCEPDDVAYSNITTWEEEEKFILSLKKLDLKTNNDEFKVKIEWNWLEDEIDTFNTFFSVESDSVNANFYFSPEETSTWDSWIEDLDTEEDITDTSDDSIIYDNQSRSAKYIWQYPNQLEMSLYKWNIASVYDIENHTLIAKATWLSLSTNLEIESQDWAVFSLVTKISWSNAAQSIKVYTISKFWAKIISADVYPTIAKSWAKVSFDIIANIYNAMSDLDYAQIIFEDDRFEKLNLTLLEEDFIDDVSESSKELTFSWDYILPSDNTINWQFISYDVYVILKDWTRTKFEWNQEIYVWTRDDICKDPKMCTLRWLKALKNSEKSAFEKVLIQNFDESEANFTENDLYKVFRKQ